MTFQLAASRPADLFVYFRLAVRHPQLQMPAPSLTFPAMVMLRRVRPAFGPVL